MWTSRYTKLAQLKNDKMHASSGEIRDADSLSEDMVFVMIFLLIIVIFVLYGSSFVSTCLSNFICSSQQNCIFIQTF